MRCPAVFRLAAASLALCAGAAAADPLPLPQTDYSAKAKLPEGATATLSQSGGRMRLRISVPNVPGSVLAIADFTRGRVQVMTPEAPKMAVETEIPESYRSTMIVGEGVRTGTATVAGEPCDLWEIQRAQGVSTPATACITPDGIVLRTEVETKGSKRVVYEVTGLTRGPQDASLFRLPAGTQAVKMPKGASGILQGLGIAR